MQTMGVQEKIWAEHTNHCHNVKILLRQEKLCSQHIISIHHRVVGGSHHVVVIYIQPTDKYYSLGKNAIISMLLWPHLDKMPIVLHLC